MKKIYCDEFFSYVRSGCGLETSQVGPRAPRRDGELGVWKNGLDHKNMNKYHGVLTSFFLGVFVWTASSFVGAAIALGALDLVRKAISGPMAQHVDMIGFMTAVMFLGFIGLVMPGIPYVFFLCYCTQRSFWKSLKFALWGSLLSRITGGGGGNSAVNRINRINIMGY